MRSRTPLENRLDDLYSLMQVVDPQLFGRAARILDRLAASSPHFSLRTNRHPIHLVARPAYRFSVRGLLQEALPVPANHLVP